MPTFIQQFSDTEIKVRYKEPLLTAGLDQLLTGIAPSGITRGFRLGAVASPVVTIEADAVDSDHVAVYVTADGYTLRLRRTGGDFNLNLTSLLGANKTWVIAIFIEYGVGITTFAEIRAYELSPTDEFTGAAERGELIVLGTVTESAGVLTSSNWDYRTSAWENLALESREWVQVVKNGDFEKSGVAALSPAEWTYGWITTGLNTFTWAVSAADPYVGFKHISVSGPSVTGQDNMNSLSTLQCRGGSMIRVRYAVKGTDMINVGASGMYGIQVIFYDSDGQFVSIEYVTDNTLTGTFAWTEVEGVLQAPSNAAFFRYGINLNTDGVAFGATTVLLFDAVRVFVEADRATDGHEGGVPRDAIAQFATMDMVPNLGSYADMDEFAEKTLRLVAASTSGSTFQYWWQHLQGKLPWNLLLRAGGIELDRVIESIGSDLLGNNTDAARPRITTPIVNAATAQYILLWKVENSAAGEHMRVYATSSTATKSTDALVITMNAEWDPVNLWWERDAAFDSSRIDMHKSGIAYFTRESTDADNWVDTDWDNPDIRRWMDLRGHGGTNPVNCVLDLEADLELNGLLEQLGHRYIDDADEAEKPRIRSRQMSDTVHSTPFTLLWQIDSVDSIGWIRIYATGGHALGLEEGLVVTVNAKWDASANAGAGGWYRDVSATNQDSFRLVVQQFAFLLQAYRQTDPTGWLESAWATASEFYMIVTPRDDGTNQGSSLELRDGRLYMQDVTHFTNPLGNATTNINPLSNSLYAKNIVKAWGMVQATVTSPTIIASFGVASVSYGGTDGIVVNLHDSMDPEQGTAGNTDWVVMAKQRGAAGFSVTVAETQDQNTFAMKLWVESGGSVAQDTNIVGDNFEFTFIVIGEQ